MLDTLAALTLADFDSALAGVGLDVRSVAAGPGQLPRIDTERRGGPDAHLVLVVTTYALNAEGKRYFDTETHEAATEIRRFHLAGDLHLIPIPTQPEGETNG